VNSTLAFQDIAAFLAWVEPQPARYELIDGEARIVSGATRAHARIAANALSSLTMFLGDGPCEAYGVNLAVIAATMRVFYPDVSVSCETEGEDALRTPCAVIEVLSPETEAVDCGRKAQDYRRMPSMRHVVLVAQDRLSIEHHRRGTSDEPFTIEHLSSPADVLRIEAAGAEIAVADLYRNVSV